MLHWTLTDSLTADGRFRSVPAFFESLSADYYYGVAFLDVIGFWDPKKRFWSNEDFPQAAEVCRRILASVMRQGAADSAFAHVRDRLRQYCAG